MKTSDKLNELSKAMAKMQGEMNNVIKSSKGYNYKYADLASVWDVLRAPLSNNGLFVMQEALTLPEGVSVTTRVFHSSGQWVETGPLVIPMGKKDAHSVGSSITYSKRYGLCAALGVVSVGEDDDASQAMKNAPVAPTKVESHPLCTESEFKSFVEEWSKTYDKEKIESYIEKRSSHFNIHPRATVSILMKEQNKFEKEFKVWEAKKR